MSTNPAEPAASGSGAADQFALDLAAFDRTAAQRAALAPEQVGQYSLDATFAVGRALQIHARLLTLRPEFAQLPGFDLAHLDGFEDLARGLRYANAEVQRRIQRMKETPALADKGFRLRAMMMAYLEAVAFKGAVDPALIARLKEGSGYRDLAEDLVVIAHELQSRPELIGPEALVNRKDVAEGTEIAHQLLVHLGSAELDAQHEGMLLARNRLGALLVRSHAQLRRAVDYLRFDQGDAADLVPTLFVPGGPRRPAGAAESAAELAAVHEHLHATDPADSPFSED